MRRLSKINFYNIILIFLALLLCSCEFSNTKEEAVNEKEIKKEVKPEAVKENDLSIVTTDKFVYYMVKDIVKYKNNVDFIFKNRNDEMNYTFSEDSLENISKKDLFFYVGANFEPWIGDFTDKLNKNKVSTVNISRGIKLLPYSKEIKYNNVIFKDNPYYWLNIDNYKISLLNIKNAIQDKDAKNWDFYEQNYNEVLKEIEKYEKNLKELSQLSKDYIYIYSEDSVEYFIKYSNFKNIKVSPNLVNKEELDNLETKLKENKDKIIFIYDRNDELNKNLELIKKFNMTTVCIRSYEDDFIYNKLLENNIKNLRTQLKIK